MRLECWIPCATELGDPFVIELLLFCLTIAAANDTVLRIDAEAPFPRQISEYGLFTDATGQIPSDGLVPYDVISPLFSDYAEKYRFVHIPDGTSITYKEDDSFEFPVGAALIKTFAYPALSGDGLDLVETRVMIHRSSGWEGAAYVWNDDQTEARLAIAGKRVPVAWRVRDGSERSTTYFVPNMNQCKQCHQPNGETVPIGFQPRHINRTSTYDGVARNQIDHFVASGILTDTLESVKAPRAARWDDPALAVEVRARAYLDINCAHCHTPKGMAGHTNLFLTYTQNDPRHRGILKRPTSAGPASMNMEFAIRPGDPNDSFLLQRLLSTETAIRMPQIMRTVVHEEGVALIRDWIESLGSEKTE